MKQEKAKGQAGFSMIELMVSTVMLAFVITGIATLYPRAMSYSVQSRQLNRAFAIAHGKVEEFYRMPANAAALTAGNHGPEQQENFTCTWNIQLDYPIAKMRRVTVGVSWITGASFDSIGVVTYILK
jgi:prepilin-type N-terminal cleavage/methylation domain-containing protein